MPLIPPMPEGATRKRNVLDVLEAKPKSVLIRVDFNVPMKDGVITDDSRIVKALPTIQTVWEAGCTVILVSHMGRPKLVQKGEDTDGKQRAELSLKPVADHLSTKLGKEVVFGGDCMEAKSLIEGLPAGSVCLLENLRFYKEEEKNGEDFARTLASYADAYVNDAFGTCHRAHASVSGVPALLDPKLTGIGALVASELAYLDFSGTTEADKIAAIIGGSKVSTKLPVIKGLLKNVQVLVLGGGLAFTFLKAQGVAIGDSLVEDGMIDTAKELLAEAEASGTVIVLPVDSVASQKFPSAPMDKKDTKTFNMTPGAGIEDGWMGLDAGPESVKAIAEGLKGCSKVIMNGPLGVFEVAPFDEGTIGLVDILETITKEGTITVVGGGDSVAALEQFGKTEAVSYVSTGGGATLELLAGDILPGVAAIPDYE